MWNERDEQGEDDDLLSESRMYVVFANGASRRRAFGPYRTVQVTADSVWVYEDSSPLRIARKQAGGCWEIPDGSDRPAAFRQVLILCPPRGASAEQIEQRLAPGKRW